MKRGGPIARKTGLARTSGFKVTKLHETPTHTGYLVEYSEGGFLEANKLKRKKGLKQGRSTGTPTKAEAERMAKIPHLGCIACFIELKRNSANLHAFFGQQTACEVHHLNVGGKHGQKRRGHRYTIGLCSWHHRGESTISTIHERVREILGPSFLHHARAFRERYGSDDELLELQDDLLKTPLVVPKF